MDLPTSLSGLASANPRNSLSGLSGPLGDRRVVTVLFADVSGFTAMSEQLDPEEVTDLINQCFKALSAPIVQYGGTIDKYMGDAIMAIFGAPVAHEDDPVRAVQAAWSMQQEAERFAAGLVDRTGVHLKVRIGINTGLVVAGAVGGTERSDYTVMGDTVNLAQRMESNAQPGKVLVTEKTASASNHVFDFRTLEPISVKGKAEPVAVFEVVGPRWDTERKSAEHLVGRDAQLQTLHVAMEQAFGGHPQLVQVVGDAGMGKSALVRAFATSLQTRGSCRVLRGRCFSYDSLNSFGLIHSLLRRWFGISPHESALAILNVLRPKVYQYPFADAERAVALLAHLFAVECRHPEVDALPPQRKRSEGFAVLDEMITAEVAKGALLLSFDDVQWADEESLEWLEGLIRHLDDPEAARPVMVLLQHRPEFARDPGQGARTFSRTRLGVGPLAADAGLELVGRALGEERSPAEWGPELQAIAASVHARCAGNPYYVTEMVRNLVECGALVRTGGAWTVGPGVEADGDALLPESVKGMMAARLDRLSHRAREVLQVASVVGRNFDRVLLGEVSAYTDLDGGLTELQDAGLIRPEGDGWAFCQELTQQVAYSSLLVKVRRSHHVLVADALAARHAGNVVEVASTLARHYLQGEAPAQALAYLYMGADFAARATSLSKAKGLLEEALGCCDQLPHALPTLERWRILQTLAGVEAGLGLTDQALAHLEAALADLALEGGGGAEAGDLHRAAAEVLAAAGRWAEAVTRYRAALSAVSGATVDPGVFALRGKVLVAAVRLLLTNGEHAAAAALAVEHAEGTEHAPAATRTELAGLRALALERLGDAGAAAAWDAFACQLEAIDPWDEPLLAARLTGELGQLAAGQGEGARALTLLNRAADAYRSEGGGSALAVLLLDLEGLVVVRGDETAAVALLDEAQGIADALGDAHLVARVEVARAEQLLARGALGPAEEAARLAIVIQDPAVAPFAAAALGEALLARLAPHPYPPKDLDDARAFSEACDVLRAAVGSEAGPRAEGRARRTLSAVYLWAGRKNEALAMAGRAVNLLKEAADRGDPDPAELGRAFEQLAAVLDALGKAELAKEARAEASARWARLKAEAASASPAS